MRRHLVATSLLALAACATTQSAVVTPIAPMVATQDVGPETFIGLNAICSAENGDGRTPSKYLKLAAGMGTGGFTVDTKSKAAQDWFDYGLALSHSFYHEDAKAAMKRSTEADPACALCAWGLAWALGPTLNYGLSDDDKKAALAAAQIAKSLVKPGDAKAAALTDAIVARYEKGTEQEFGKAMEKIAASNPDERELAVLAAHSLLIPVRAGDESGLKSALALLEDVLRKSPDDTGAIHYYIHATEFDGRPVDAISYAERLGQLAPAASHLVHMPAHTFFHAGRYEEAAMVNAKAIEADTDWIRAGGNPNAPGGKAEDLPMYYAHNLAFGLAGSLMAGDAQMALKYAAHAAKVYPEGGPPQRGTPLPRTYVALARYAPDEMLALPPSKELGKFALYRAYGRGEALLQKGDAAGARAELANLHAVADSTERNVAEGVLAGRIAMAEGNARKAVDLFLAAAKKQETEFEGYMDPPQWWYPVRRSAAAAWLKAGNFAKAEEEAVHSLRLWREDPLALWVLGNAQLGLGHLGQGEATLAQARDLWRGDFDSITVEAI